VGAVAQHGQPHVVAAVQRLRVQVRQRCRLCNLAVIEIDHPTKIFLGGILGAWLLGLWVIRRMEQCHPAGDNPFQFRGMDEWRPGLALLLLLAFLGLVGFPLTPAFLGQDLLLYHVSGEHAWLAPLITVALVLNGISLSGVYMRLCAGRPTELRSARPAS